ncbi:hypothetical protein KBZ20_09065 [Vulcanococcus limneticus Candia 3F8]|uniref:DUF6790 family protein n=1 Tax=Vulcanococcus limneticus TaxID=2170428 RepID=UPI000B986C68|nr:DUF6790 family protein [Vulcanococcus limneticus]MCP9792115.1 hypothetical protein [Vulcanococcus limneticus MW73D5]MCP9893922.1 hypothetical protein [Vulcanococcus limneticus Candia 3F8]MCP9897471.1 hypothetical protein [Vulcanococcus limneticus Candia 3B3]
MTKQNLAVFMEWLRPVGIGLAFVVASFLGHDAISRFHILGPFVVVLMSGTVAFESLVLGEAASVKIGYAPNHAYQVQSGLANAATAVTALLVYALDWGRHADATIVTAMLMFFSFSAANHAASAIMERDSKPVNLLRPALSLVLIGFLLPAMIQALSQP